MNLRRVISGLVAATLLVSTASDVQAQSRRSSAVASLGRMGCIAVRNGGYQAINQDIPIGRQILRAIGYMGIRVGLLSPADLSAGIPPGYSIEATCRLAAPNETPKFRTLILSVGFADNSYERDLIRTDGAVTVRLSVYREGNFYKSVDISMGDKMRFPVDVKGQSNITLEAQCIRGGEFYGKTTCPFLYFFEDVLER